jgi:hypothetical protein
MFYKNVNKNSSKEMYEYLKGHFTYFTNNSWNREKSIANNVKLYNLELDGDWGRLLEILEIDEYFTINTMIEEWESLHRNYKVGFNGRSAGYLVLYTFEDWYVENSENYAEFKELLKNDGFTLKDYHNTLKEEAEMVQSFDELCDNLREACQYMLSHAKIVEKEEQIIRKYKDVEWDD